MTKMAGNGPDVWCCSLSGLPQKLTQLLPFGAVKAKGSTVLASGTYIKATSNDTHCSWKHNICTSTR